MGSSAWRVLSWLGCIAWGSGGSAVRACSMTSCEPLQCGLNSNFDTYICPVHEH
jgi:hypothetical protein